MSEPDYKKKYEELLAKYQEAQKHIEALQKRCQELERKSRELATLKAIEIAYEQKSEIDDFIRKYLGQRPTFGGGSTLRWELFESLLKKLFEEKEGDYREFVRRFARQQGLTERKLEYGYIKPLIDDGVIEVFYGNDGVKWRWKIDVKKYGKR
ncbi:MAG: hypothetical protein QXH03_02615 [Candidatus Bathyarchaeia archaeon]